MQNKGQANLEYLMVLLIVFSMYQGVKLFLRKSDFPGKLVANFEKNYRPLYQYGHIKAKGPDDIGGGGSGAFVFHPRLNKSTGSNVENRFFINPKP